MKIDIQKVDKLWVATSGDLKGTSETPAGALAQIHARILDQEQSQVVEIQRNSSFSEKDKIWSATLRDADGKMLCGARGATRVEALQKLFTVELGERALRAAIKGEETTEESIFTEKGDVEPAAEWDHLKKLHKQVQV